MGKIFRDVVVYNYDFGGDIIDAIRALSDILDEHGSKYDRICIEDRGVCEWDIVGYSEE